MFEGTDCSTEGLNDTSGQATKSSLLTRKDHIHVILWNEGAIEKGIHPQFEQLLTSTFVNIVNTASNDETTYPALQKIKEAARAGLQ